MKFKQPRIFLASFILAATLVLPAHAQTALYKLDGDKAFKLVHKMDDRASYIVDPSPNDSASGTVLPRYRLQPVEEFFPALVNVKVLKANFARAGLDSVHRLNQTFSFTAKFSSDYDLADTFFVLAFNTDALEGKYYAQEIPQTDLRQGKAITIEARLPPDENIDRYELHVFSRGLEVFNSNLPREAIAGALGRMAAKRIKGVKNAAPKPLTGPMPRYPEKLQDSKITGRAIVSCVIAPSGQPIELTLKSATEPAFGEAALAVLSQWWFVPKVENGQPVATKAELPFEFKPPKQ